MGYYVVLPGDTLTSIAKKQLGDANQARAIAALNQLKNMNQIRVGQKLKLPTKGTAEEGSSSEADTHVHVPACTHSVRTPLTAGTPYEICPYEVNAIQAPPFQHFSLYHNFQEELTQQCVLLCGSSRPLDKQTGNISLYLVKPEDCSTLPSVLYTRLAKSKDCYAAEETQVEEVKKELIKVTNELNKEARKLIDADLKKRNIEFTTVGLDEAERNSNFYVSKTLILPQHITITDGPKKLSLQTKPNNNNFINFPDSSNGEEAFLPVVRKMEGYREILYTDGVGLPTTGIGWLIQNREYKDLIYFKSDGHGGYELTNSPKNNELIECYTDHNFTIRANEEEIRKEINKVRGLGKSKNLGTNSSIYLKEDYINKMTPLIVKAFANQLRKSLPDFDTYPLPAQLSLLDLAYNCGKYILLTGRAQGLKKEVLNQNWKQAIDHLLTLRDPRLREKKILVTNGNKKYLISTGLRGYLARNLINAQWFLAAQHIKDAAHS